MSFPNSSRHLVILTPLCLRLCVQKEKLDYLGERKKCRRDDSELSEAVLGTPKKFNQIADVITTDSESTIQKVFDREVRLALESTQKALEELKILISSKK